MAKPIWPNKSVSPSLCFPLEAPAHHLDPLDGQVCGNLFCPEDPETAGLCLRVLGGDGG